MESLKAFRIPCKVVTLLMNACCRALCLLHNSVRASLKPPPNASTVTSINCEDVRSTNTERFASTGHVVHTSSSDSWYVMNCTNKNEGQLIKIISLLLLVNNPDDQKSDYDCSLL